MAKCEKVFADKLSGATAQRKGLEEALAFLRPGDTFVVWKLDRAGRSLAHLMELLSALQQREISFVSLTEQIDTSTPSGKLIFHLMAALAQFERDLIRERTQAGLLAARARGRKGGQPKALTPKQAAIAQALYDDKSNSISDICKTLHISRATLYRYINVK